MAQALRPSEHLRRLIGSNGYFPDWRVQFYVSHYARTRSTLCDLKRCFLKKRIIGMRGELGVRKPDFGNFQVEERMGNTQTFLEGSSIKNRISNLSLLIRKLKFHTFSCLKFCFKISKI